MTANYLTFEGHEYDCATVRDITDRKRAEQLLRQSEERFRQITITVQDVFWVADAETAKNHYISPAFEQIWERSSQSLIEDARLFFDTIHPEDRERVFGGLAAKVEKRPFEHEYRIIRPDGSIRWIRDRGFPVPATAMTEACYVGAAQDITERKQVELANAGLLAILEGTPDFVGSADAKTGEIQYINRAGREMVGLASDDGLSHRRLSEFLPEWTNRLMREVIFPTAAREGVWTGECAFLHRDGREIPVMMVLLAHKSPSGEVERFSTISRDITDRKRAEKALRESEDRFSKAFHHNQVAMFIRRLSDDVLIETNASFERMVHCSKEELIGRRVGDLGLYVDPKQRAEVLVRAGRREPIEGMELELHTGDGFTIHVLKGVDYIALGDEACALATFTDITDRKRAERALWEREAVLLQSQRIARIGSWSVELTTDNVIWTDETYRLYGVSRETFVPSAEAISALAHPDDRGPLQGHVEAFLAGKTPGPLEFRVLLPDGQERVWCGQGEMFRDDAGRPSQMIGTVQDITDRKRAEQSLRLAQFSMDRAGSPIYWVGPDAMILYVNDAACRMLGYSMEELTRKTIHDIDPLAAPSALAAGWEELRRRRSYTFETNHVTKDGRVLDVEVTSNFIEYEGRELDCAIVRNITERKRVEESLRESEQRNRTILRTVMDGFWRNDLQGRVLEVNEAYCRDERLQRTGTADHERSRSGGSRDKHRRGRPHAENCGAGRRPL